MVDFFTEYRGISWRYFLNVFNCFDFILINIEPFTSNVYFIVERNHLYYFFLTQHNVGLP